MTVPICFVDTETTSLRPDRRAWDIAIIRVDDDHPDGLVAQFFIDLDSLDLPNSDPFSLRVGRFWGRHPQALALQSFRSIETVPVDGGGLYPSESLHPLRGAVLTESRAAQVVAAYTHGAHFVGAVPSFDAEVLAALLRDNWLTPSWHYHLIDVEVLAAGWLARDGRAPAPPWRSDDVAAALGVDAPDDGELHTALGDARWARRIYDRVMGGAA